MNRQDHEHLAQWDAAYVLGALTPADRRVYEEHKERCRTCRDSVDELSSMPGLLAQIRPESDLAHSSDEPVDPTITMLPVGRRHPGLGRRLAIWVAAAAAVLLLAVPAVLMLQTTDDAVSVALQPLDSEPAAMSIQVTLASTDWGTRLSVECEYPADMDYQERQTWYALMATDADGSSTQVSTWRMVPGETVVLEAATAMSLADMSSLTVVTAAGEEVFGAPIPAH